MLKIPFLSRLVLCMFLSLVLNMAIGHYIKLQLSKGDFMLSVDAVYSTDATMELMLDTGKNFNQQQRIPIAFEKGRNTKKFSFKLKDIEQLRYVRLDFGTNTALSEVEINSIYLSNRKRELFRLEKNQVGNKIGLKIGILSFDPDTATFIIDSDRKPFDPYIVFDAVNELMFPNWKRTIALVLPWVILFLLPLLKWFADTFEKVNYTLIFTGLFCAAIPLKIAWVTFTTLLLLVFALFYYYKNRKLNFNAISKGLLLLFFIPLIGIRNGDLSLLGIPIGFALFVSIGTLIDFSEKWNQIKKTYITVFFLVASITVVSWLLLIVCYGYYYNINLSSYFTQIKTHSHATMFWLYYRHTTFLSFFIVVGGIFCFDLYKKKVIGRTYGLLYGLLGLIVLLLLGSRFALLMGVSLPILVQIPIKQLGRWLMPAWVIIAVLLTYCIGDIDFRRNQLWSISWDAIREKPLLGHGTGSSETILNNLERMQNAGFDTLLEMNHSHNQMLSYLLENGLLGVLLFLVGFSYIVRHFAKLRNKSMLLFCFLTLLLMITESPFRTTTPLYVICFLFSVFASEPNTKLSTSTNNR